MVGAPVPPRRAPHPIAVHVSGAAQQSLGTGGGQARIVVVWPPPPPSNPCTQCLMRRLSWPWLVSLEEVSPRILPSIFRNHPGFLSANLGKYIISASEHPKIFFGVLHRFLECIMVPNHVTREGALIIQKEKLFLLYIAIWSVGFDHFLDFDLGTHRDSM